MPTYNVFKKLSEIYKRHRAPKIPEYLISEFTYAFRCGCGNHIPEGTPKGRPITSHCARCGRPSRLAIHVSGKWTYYYKRHSRWEEATYVSFEEATWKQDLPEEIPDEKAFAENVMALVGGDPDNLTGLYVHLRALLLDE